MPKQITPALKYPGGQKYSKAHIWALAPKHRIRIYGCVGGWGEGWNWEHEGVGEIINDTDGDLINFYEVLADTKLRKEMIQSLLVTPFSSEQFRRSSEFLVQPKQDKKRHSPAKWAYHYFCCIRMSMLGAGKSFAPISIGRLRRNMLEQVSAFVGAIEGLPEAAIRLTDVLILRMRVNLLVKKYDKKGVFIFLDPPFHPSTRAPGLYRKEMTAEEHDELLAALGALKHAKFMLCGYRCKPYTRAEKKYGWKAVNLEKANASSKTTTKEVKVQTLWMNYVPKQ
jgi:DNA adenine methylase